jgi:hypothetical protein
MAAVSEKFVGAQPGGPDHHGDPALDGGQDVLLDHQVRGVVDQDVHAVEGLAHAAEDGRAADPLPRGRPGHGGAQVEILRLDDALGHGGPGPPRGPRHTDLEHGRSIDHRAGVLARGP